jgi:UBX domain-containing protein 1
MSGQGSSSKPPPKKKFATLGDLNSGGAHPGHGHDDEEDSDDENQDLFAGGEKSGLAVQNPDHHNENLQRRILEKARKNNQRAGGDDPVGPSSHFSGTARTLGGDDTPSQTIPDTRANLPKGPERAERRLHFWANGFSVDDGPLYANSDPANAEILKMIKSGRAPLSIMNVSHAQEVDVKVEQHEGNYVAPKKKYVPFAGGGQRLGSPTPAAHPQSTPGAFPVDPAPPALSGSTTASAPAVDVDDSQPTISLQIRLGDGTRLVSRFNTTHTIGDVYDFVNAANAASVARPWTLMTTFPSKELGDKDAVLGEMAEFKRGGTVVQKWN